MKCQYCGEFAARDETCFDCFIRLGDVGPEHARRHLTEELTRFRAAIEKGPGDWKARVDRRLAILRGEPVSAIDPATAPAITGKLKVRGLK